MPYNCENAHMDDPKAGLLLKQPGSIETAVFVMRSYNNGDPVYMIDTKLNGLVIITIGSLLIGLYGRRISHFSSPLLSFSI